MPGSIILAMQRRFSRIWAIPVSILILIGLYYVPPIHSRLAWRLELLRTQIKYMVNPPDEAVFLPTQQAQVNLAVTKMILTLQATLTPAAASTPQPGPTLQPTITATPLPATVMLQGVKYETSAWTSQLLRSCQFLDGAYLLGLDGKPRRDR